MSDLRTHIRTAVQAALILVLCQLVVELLGVALWSGPYLLSPEDFFGAQMYDFCVKLFLLLPGSSLWVTNGVLDRFAGDGFATKLGLGSGLLLPNLLVGGMTGLAVGAARSLLRRRPDFRGALLWLLALGLVVEVAIWLTGVSIPKAWTIWVLIRRAGRVLIWEGTILSIAVLVVATGLALLVSRLQARSRWAACLGLCATIGVAIVLGNTSGVSSAAVRPEVTNQPPSPVPPVDNVVLISIDSLRADRLGSYGNSHDTSPTLDRLASEGVRFTNVSSSSSWTLPAHMSMLTGRDTLAHGVIADSDRLSSGVTTLADVMQQGGRATAAIVSTPVLGARFGFDRGFQLYDDDTIPAATAFDSLKDEPAPKVTELATNWLRENGSKPFFLFLHFWDVHYDYIPPPPYDTMFDPDYEGTVTGTNFFQDPAINKRLPKRDIEHLFALYDGEIRWVDDHIAKILALLDELGLAGKTAVIVTADHGDEFFEHGFKGHGRTLYREVTEVPLIVRAPGVRGGQVVEAPVSLIDIMPTVLDLTGLLVPQGVNGLSLVPLMVADRGLGRDAVIGWLCSLNHRTNCLAMQNSDTGTLIHFFQPLRLEFYAPDDQGQQHNIAKTDRWPRAEQLAALVSRLNGGWASYRKLPNERGKMELDEATREQLRNLGYKQD